ncbi:MAG: hypothetical protein JO287_14545 [Pseudonocardiales bacterium]|nr:hypothetical protein [Pseudonocardiales bacterium]
MTATRTAARDTHSQVVPRQVLAWGWVPRVLACGLGVLRLLTARSIGLGDVLQVWDVLGVSRRAPAGQSPPRGDQGRSCSTPR